MNKDVKQGRFPLKHVRDAFALGQIMTAPIYSKRQKLNCLKFYSTADGIRNLHTSPGRSGAAWLMLGVELALDLAEGGNGEYEYIDGLWVPDGGTRFLKFDWRIPCGTLLPPVTRPQFFHTQLPYFRVRSAQLKNMKIVIVVRSILECIDSKFFKSADGDFDLDVTRDDFESFPWNDTLSHYIEYYNSWGDVTRWHKNHLVFKYHELKEDPAGTHKAMTDFWGLDIPEECLAEAFRRITKSEMKKKLTKKQIKMNPRASYRKERGKLPEEKFRYIIEKLEKELAYDFGYHYGYSHQYGHEYD